MKLFILRFSCSQKSFKWMEIFCIIKQTACISDCTKLHHMTLHVAMCILFNKQYTHSLYLSQLPSALRVFINKIQQQSQMFPSSLFRGQKTFRFKYKAKVTYSANAIPLKGGIFTLLELTRVGSDKPLVGRPPGF